MNHEQPEDPAETFIFPPIDPSKADTKEALLISRRDEAQLDSAEMTRQEQFVFAEHHSLFSENWTYYSLSKAGRDFLQKLASQKEHPLLSYEEANKLFYQLIELCGDQLHLENDKDSLKSIYADVKFKFNVDQLFVQQAEGLICFSKDRKKDDAEVRGEVDSFMSWAIWQHGKDKSITFSRLFVAIS